MTGKSHILRGVYVDGWMDGWMWLGNATFSLSRGEANARAKGGGADDRCECEIE